MSMGLAFSRSRLQERIIGWCVQKHQASTFLAELVLEEMCSDRRRRMARNPIMSLGTWDSALLRTVQSSCDVMSPDMQM